MIHDIAKKRTDFVIRLVGPGLKPWDVGFRYLSRVLDAVQRLVEQVEEPEDGTIRPEPSHGTTEKVLRLVDVRIGSAAYRVAAPNPTAALKRISETGNAIAKPGEFDWSLATLSSLKELSEVAKSLGCRIELRRGISNDVLATIEPSTYELISKSAYIEGYTTVFARVERVGGATEMHCGIRLPSSTRRMVICRVLGEELVRELGKYIYQDVTLHGRATWLRKTMTLRTLAISACDPPKTAGVKETMSRLRKISGKAWDQVKDPHGYIAEMRGA